MRRPEPTYPADIRPGASYHDIGTGADFTVWATAWLPGSGVAVTDTEGDRVIYGDRYSGLFEVREIDALAGVQLALFEVGR